MLRLPLVFCLVFSIASPAIAERRVALVVGVDAYVHLRPLENAVNDAEAMAARLGSLGFEVKLLPDIGLEAFRAELAEFRDAASQAEVAAVFYAGHGVEIAGRNRVLPADTRIASLAEIEASSILLDEIRAAASAAPVALIFLDACRNDPFGGTEGGRSGTALGGQAVAAARPGLGRMGRSENTLFAFSAAPGETALDGTGVNSPFTAALVRYLGTEGLEIRSTLTLVAQEVYETTRGRQLPYVESGLPATFFAVPAAQSDLSEREILLLAMSGIAPPVRAEVERVAAEEQVPLAPLYAAVLSGDLAAGTRENLREGLASAARSFRETRAAIDRLGASDPQVAALRVAALAALAAGETRRAQDLLDQALAVDAASAGALGDNLIKRIVSRADTMAMKATIASSVLDHPAAIAALEEADVEHARIERLEPGTAAIHRRVELLDRLGQLYLDTGFTAQALATFERLAAVAGPEDALPAARRLVDVLLLRGEVAKAKEQLDGLGPSREIEDGIRRARVSLALGEPGEAAQICGDWRAYELGWTIFPLVRQPGDENWHYGMLPEGAAEPFADYPPLAGLEIRIRHGWRPWDLGRRQLVAQLALCDGDADLALGDAAAAVSAYDAAIRMAALPAGIFLQDGRLQRALIDARYRKGAALVATGDLDGAGGEFLLGLEVAAAASGRDPSNTGWMIVAAQGYAGHAAALAANGFHAEAVERYRAATGMLASLWFSDSEDLALAAEYYAVSMALGDAEARAGAADGGKSSYLSALQVAGWTLDHDSEDAGWQLREIRARLAAGAALEQLGDAKAALALYVERLDKQMRAAIASEVLSALREVHLRIAAITHERDPQVALESLVQAERISSVLVRAYEITSSYDMILQLYLDLGDAALATGDAGAAREYLVEAQRIVRELAEPANQPEDIGRVVTLRIRVDLALKDYAAAGRGYAVAIAQLAGRPDEMLALSREIHSLALSIDEAGDTAAAIPLFEAGLEHMVAAARDHAEDGAWQFHVVRRQVGLADALRRVGRHEDALPLLTSAIETSRRNLKLRPDDPDWLVALAYDLLRLGLVLERVGDTAGAKAPLEESARLTADLVALRPDVPDYQTNLKSIAVLLAQSAEAAGDDAEAMAQRAAAAEASRTLIDLGQRGADDWYDLWRQQMLAGHAADRLGNAAAAAQFYAAAAETMTVLSDSDTTNEVWLDDLRYSHMRAGLMAARLQNWDTAERQLDAALRVARRLAGLAPDDVDRQITLVQAYYNAGAVKDDRALAWGNALQLAEDLLTRGGLTEEQIATLKEYRSKLLEN